MRSYIRAAVHGGISLLISQWLGSERERGRGWGHNVPFKGVLPVTLLLSTMCQLLKASPLPNSATGWKPNL
jgi:hypothetical protein